IILKNGRVKDFKLNTQCSAGNGYFLQSTAQGFNVQVEQYADIAFAAKGFPSFGYGCAVFMQSDIVDFQRQGWKPEEIMAGLCNNGRVSTFIGLDACANIQYKTTREEATRCYFCKNKCLRTFIDVKTNQLPADYKRPSKTKVPLEEGAQRLIIATCEKGTVENIEEMRGIKGNLDKVKKANPNFVEIAAKGVFRVPDAPIVSDPLPKFQITAAQKKRAELLKKRGELRIGMPRVLNMYSQTPIFTGY